MSRRPPTDDALLRAAMTEILAWIDFRDDLDRRLARMDVILRTLETHTDARVRQAVGQIREALRGDA